MNQSESDDHNEKCQLDMYLDETPLELKYYQNLDVLKFWKNKKNRYLELSIIASDVLSIPITTVASESAFSISARVLKQIRVLFLVIMCKLLFVLVIGYMILLIMVIFLWFYFKIYLP